MENENELELPEILEPHREKLISSVQHFIEMIPTEDKPSKAWQSCFGGNPYLPKGTPFPTTESGEELFFLGQINFADAPKLEPFPAAGILQFYILDDQNYGLDSENPLLQDGFRVLYFPDVILDESQLITDFSFLRSYGDLPVYPGECFGMDLVNTKELVPVEDYQFEEKMGADFFEQYGEEQWEVYELYHNSVSSDGHKIGGYAHFAQEDPRKAESPYLLLCQFDTDNDIESMWGDMGTAHFFIKEEDLRQKDFSKVWFHWDCY